MKWNRYYTSPSTVASFIFGELCYKKPIDIITKISGIENSYLSYVERDKGVLSEHVKYSEDSAKAELGYKYFLDPEKRKIYFQKTIEIIQKTQNYIKYVEGCDMSKLTTLKILEMVQRAEPIYNESMGYYLLSQPEYTAKLNKVFLLNLETYISKEKVQDSFITLIESDKISCLEDERLDWLENIILPYLKNKDRFNKDLVIETHVEKYKYLSASAQSKPWDKNHFDKVFEEESKKRVEEVQQEITEMEDKENRVKNKKVGVIKEYDLPENLIHNIEILSELGSLRLEAHLRGWQFFQYFGPVLVEKTAELLSLEKEDVYNLKFDEFISLLEGRLTITDEYKLRRGGNILVITTPEKGEETYFGDEAKNKYETDIREEILHVSEFYGQTVNGKGKLIGEVFVFRWGAEDIEKQIYEFPEGKILVAGQTLPLFMPALRKAIAIVTNEGGVLCHAAIVSRELNKPAIIGTKIATELLKDGDIIEMDLDNQKITIVKSDQK